MARRRRRQSYESMVADRVGAWTAVACLLVVIFCYAVL
jgi:hypothetical protein